MLLVGHDGTGGPLHDGRLYVGEYVNGDPGSLYSYALGPGGTLLGIDGRSRPDAPAPLVGSPGLDGSRYEGSTPNDAQGVAVHGSGYLFTQSHGDDDPGELLQRPSGPTTQARSVS